jgi:hypothetical protein
MEYERPSLTSRTIAGVDVLNIAITHRTSSVLFRSFRGEQPRRGVSRVLRYASAGSHTWSAAPR